MCDEDKYIQYKNGLPNPKHFFIPGEIFIQRHLMLFAQSIMPVGTAASLHPATLAEIGQSFPADVCDRFMFDRWRRRVHQDG